MQNYVTVKTEDSQGERKHSRAGKPSRSKILKNNPTAEITAGDKFLSRQHLEPEKVPVPKTVLHNNRRERATDVWQAVVGLAGVEGEVKLDDVAKRSGYSKRSVRRILNDFEQSLGGLFTRKSIPGQGRGTLIKNKFARNFLRRDLGQSWQKARHSEKAVPNWKVYPDTIRDKNKNSRKTFSLRRDRVGNSTSSQNKNSSKNRQVILKDLPKDLILEKGRPFYSFFMEKFRKYIWKNLQNGDNSKVAQRVNRTITSQIGAWLDGATVGMARELFEDIYGDFEFVWKVEAAIRNEENPYQVASKGVFFRNISDPRPNGDLRLRKTAIKPEKESNSNEKSSRDAKKEKSKKEIRWRLQKERRPSNWKYSGLETVSNILGGKQEREGDSKPSARERKAIKIAKTYGAEAAAKRTGVSKKKVEKLLKRG